MRSGVRVLCKCTPCFKSNGEGIKQSVRTEHRHRQKENDRVKKAAARELRQQKRDMRRQEVLAAEAEEEAEIAHAEVEAAQYSSDGDEFESAFGHSGFDETLHDSRSSDSGASASESKSAASLTPPASPRKSKLFFCLRDNGSQRNAH